MYLLRMQMYATFTGISKEKQCKSYFQLSKGLQYMLSHILLRNLQWVLFPVRHSIRSCLWLIIQSGTGWWWVSGITLLEAIAYVRPHCPHRRQQLAEDVWSVMVTGHACVWLLSFSDFLTVSPPVLGLTRYDVYCAAVWSWSMIAACSRDVLLWGKQDSVLPNEIKVSMYNHFTLYTLTNVTV